MNRDHNPVSGLRCCTDAVKRARLDDATAALRREGWSVRDVFYAIKNGSDATKRAVYDIDGSPEALVASILADRK